MEVVKWTLAAARMACASDSVIQSAAEGIAYSEVLTGALDGAPDFDGFAGPAGASPPFSPAGAADAAASDDESEPPDGPFSALPSAEPSSRPDADPDFTAARRSFFAHPEPL